MRVCVCMYVCWGGEWWRGAVIGRFFYFSFFSDHFKILSSFTYTEHTCQHLDIQNLDTQWPGVQGQSPWRGSRAFCNFKGQGNTIFILKINVLKVQTGSVTISPLFFRNRDVKKKKKKSGQSCKSGRMADMTELQTENHSLE